MRWAARNVRTRTVESLGVQVASLEVCLRAVGALAHMYALPGSQDPSTLGETLLRLARYGSAAHLSSSFQRLCSGM